MPYSIARGKGCSPSKPWAVVKDTDGSVVACHTSKDSALAQIRALYAAEPALAKARERITKHLPGQHSQKTHATGGGGTPDGGAPKKRNKKDIAADDQRALELYESGKTWDQVAEEMGFANGGVARRAGKRHEERRKAGDGTDKKPDETPDKIDKPEPPKPTPPPVDVTNPRPMTDKDPSQQLVPTENFQEAVETGRPFKPFTEEGTSQKVRDAEQKVLDAQDDYDAILREYDPLITAREQQFKQEYDDYKAELARRKEASPRQPSEIDGAYESRITREMEADGIKEPRHPVVRDAVTDLVKDGSLPADIPQRLQAQSAILQEAYNEKRRTIQIDTAEHVLGGTYQRVPVMEDDFDAPRDPVTGKRPQKQAISQYGDDKGKPQFKDTIVMPDGQQIDMNTIIGSEGKYAIILETAKYRNDVLTQRSTRIQARRSLSDYPDREAEQLQRQQRIVDSPDTRIVVHAPLSAVSGIAASGRIKSQHETGRTKGFKGHETRAGFEAATMGVVSAFPDDKDARSKAPIYAALHLGGVRDSRAVNAEQYGEIGFVLKREVHERATFTSTDSLGLCFEPSPMTGRQTKPNGTLVNGGVSVRSFDPANDTPERFTADITPTPRRTKGYHEAQVLGGVSLADIEYVTVPKGTKFPEASRRKLAKAGIPIVEYDIADVAPPIEGTQEFYPKNGKPYTVPKFADGDWGNIPEPTTKTLGVIADIFKFRRRHNTLTPLRSLSISTNITPTVTMKHAKHDQKTHGKGGGRASTLDADNLYSAPFRARITDDGFEVDEEGMLAFLEGQTSAHAEVTKQEGKAVIAYQSELYYEQINGGLREQAIMGETDLLDPEIRTIISDVDKAIDKSGFTEDVVVFRGLDDNEGMISGMTIGDSFVDPAYQSTTLNPLVAFSFATGLQSGTGNANPVVMRIKVPAKSPALAADVASTRAVGTKVQTYRDDTEILGFSFGAEVILPRSTMYEVTGSQTIDGVQLLDVTVVRND